MKPFLFLELCVIFTSSLLLTTQLFYNCLNETHFLVIGCVGIGVAGIVMAIGYEASPLTLALYFVLSLAAMGYIVYHLGIGYIVYDFGSVSRDVFVEQTLTSELRSLPQYAERSNSKFGSYEFVCRHEGFAFIPGNVEQAYEHESCYGPLAFLIFDIPELPHYVNCQANEAGWALEIAKPGDKNQFLCMDTRRQVLTNEASIGESSSCR